MTKDEKLLLYERVIKATVAWNNNNVVWCDDYLKLFDNVSLKINKDIVDNMPVTILSTVINP